MEEQQNQERFMVSVNLPNKARETTLLPSNEQFGGGIGGVGDTGGGGGVGGGGDISKLEQLMLIYLFILPLVTSSDDIQPSALLSG